MRAQADVIVVGSGIAGITFALKLAEAGRSVLLLTKKDRAESNTNYAQGGIASVTSATDDFELHLRDTLDAGDGLVDESVARTIIEEGPSAIHELVEWGVHFSQLGDGRLSLGKEGGHSKRRILHVGDMTGRAIEQALLAAVEAHPQITVREHVMAIDLITVRRLRQRGAWPDDGAPDRVLGLYAHDAVSGRNETLAAPVVVLATGGCGQVYTYTTNPSIATGDGIAMAYRAGVPISNMEFIQFHPTALYSPAGERFLISEAVRGEGAVLRDLRGEAFMGRYDPRKDLAPRDIVARAIDREMKAAGAPHVWLDITGHPAEELRARFPQIYATCERHGLRLERDFIPVVPAAHYLCGGVVADLDGATALPGLFACGEVACTGLHGANRLASNSLLEAVVVARRGSAAALAYLTGASEPVPAERLPLWVEGNALHPDERVVLSHTWDELRLTMWNYVGIVRTTKRLERARTRIRHLLDEIRDYYWHFKIEARLLELRNLVQVADLIVRCALQRKESRGLHYTLDFPEKARQTRPSRLVRENW